MVTVDTFPIKRGVARFTDDAIRFEESFTGYLRALYRGYWQSDVLWRKGIFAGYVFALLFGIGWVVNAIRAGDFLLVSGVLVALAVLWLVNFIRGFRSPDRISLDAVDDVSATRGEKGLTRPRLVITYRDDSSTHKRRVNLPSLYTTDGETAYDQAVDAFESHGFEVER